jgi:outer membrane protein TolC
MLRARPDVRVAERKLAAQVARVGVANAMWFPKLFINGSLGLESVRIEKLISKDAFYGSIGPSISWPIFQGGNIYANVKAEEARMDEAYLAYEQALQNAYREVRDTYSAYTHEYHRYQALRGAVKAAQDAVSISKDLYRNGLRDFTAVIDAQRSLLSLEESLVISRGQITLELISLYKSLGGGLVTQTSL